MKYLKTIDIWAMGDAVRSGQLRLLPGQWVRCGSQGETCRFVRVSMGGVLHVIHNSGIRETSNRKFLRMMREQKKFAAGVAERRKLRENTPVANNNEVSHVG